MLSTHSVFLIMKGVFIVEPTITIGDRIVTIGGLTVQTLVPTCLGPIEEWWDRILVTANAGFNAVHFCPLQVWHGLVFSFKNIPRIYYGYIFITILMSVSMYVCFYTYPIFPPSSYSQTIVFLFFLKKPFLILTFSCSSNCKGMELLQTICNYTDADLTNYFFFFQKKNLSGNGIEPFSVLDS